MFTKGQQVEYDGFTGYVDFIDDAYITVCIAERERHSEDSDHSVKKVNQCCVLVCPEQWGDVKPSCASSTTVQLPPELPDGDAIITK